MNPAPDDSMTSRQPQPKIFQFTIRRLLVCTALIGVAAWVSTVGLPIQLFLSVAGERDLVPAILASLLLAAALGVLLRGPRGARDGVRAGCGALTALAAALTLFAVLREVFDWLAN